LLKTMFAAGLRSAEVCGLDVGDIQSYRNQPVLNVNGKGGKLRRVPLHPEALAAIESYWWAEGRNGDDPRGPVFRTLGKHGPYEARRLTYKAIRCLIDRTPQDSTNKATHDASHAQTHLRCLAPRPGRGPSDGPGPIGTFQHHDYPGVPPHVRGEEAGCGPSP